MRELKPEAKYELHIIFLDGRVLFLTDTLEEIYNYLKQWEENVDYLVLKKL